MEEMNWDSDYMVSIYLALGWNESKYSLTPMGIYGFLESKEIIIHVSEVNDKFIWCGIYLGGEEYDEFSEDLTEYDTFDDVMEAAIVESACYLKNRKDNDTHI